MHVTPGPASGAPLAELRRATAADHDSVDALVDVRRLVEVDYYAAVMRGLIEAAEIVEATMPRIPNGMRREGLSPAEVSKRMAIDAEATFVADLVDSQPVPRPFAGAGLAVSDPSGPGAMAGLLYVYVGSALGGLHQLRVARTAPWWRDDREHVLLRPYGGHLKDRWRAVLTALDRLDLAETNAAVLAAQAGFELFRRSLVENLALGGVR